VTFCDCFRESFAGGALSGVEVVSLPLLTPLPSGEALEGADLASDAFEVAEPLCRSFLVLLPFNFAGSSRLTWSIITSALRSSSSFFAVPIFGAARPLHYPGSNS
jgi:hypothetical protein